MHATFLKKRPLSPDEVKRRRALLAGQEFLESRVNWGHDPFIRKHLERIEAELRAVEARL